MTEVIVSLLPYMRVHESDATGLDHFRWEVSTSIAKAGFVPACVSLGTDVSKAIEKVENDLLPRLRAFQAGASALTLRTGPVPDTVDDMIHKYKTHTTSTFLTVLTERSRKWMDRCTEEAANHVFREGPYEGRRFGSLMIDQVTTDVARLLRVEYENVEEIETDPETGETVVDADTGETITRIRKRSRTAQLVFEAMKTVFNATRGIHARTPSDNPFAKQKFAARFKNETYAGDFCDLLNVIVAGEHTGLRNMATKCFVAYDLKIRVESIPTKLMVEHYKPADRPFQMLITHWKTKRATWIDLRDQDGEPLYPALERRLDDCKGDRTSGILIPKDGTTDEAWEANSDGSLTTSFYKTFRKLMKAASLPDTCKFTSFRHGGITESAEAGCTENEMMILSGHLHAGTVQLYAKKTRRGREVARKKVLSSRAEVVARMAPRAAGQAKRLLAEQRRLTDLR
jgi:hypothetical protein